RRRPHGLWTGSDRNVSARSHLRRQDPAGREGGGSTGRAADQIRAGHQPQDRQGSRPDDPAVPASAGRSGDRVVERRAFFGTLTGGLLAAPLAAEAQQAAKVFRIGFLGSGGPADHAPRVDSFRQGLRDLGYIEGRTATIEYRLAEGKMERLPALAAELVALKVDVIVASGTPTALAAKNATTTIPIVFATSGDPVGTLVASIARPGGNVTGLSLVGPELVARQLQLLKEAVPKASRVAFLSNPDNSYPPVMVKEVEAAARSLKVRMQRVESRGGAATDAAFDAMARERPNALLVLFDPVLTGQRARISELANKHRLPSMC